MKERQKFNALVKVKLRERSEEVKKRERKEEKRRGRRRVTEGTIEFKIKNEK
jgi:hypothetical protein